MYRDIVSNQHPGLPTGPIPVSLPDNILKALLPYSILATYLTHLSLINVISLTISERYKLEFLTVKPIPFPVLDRFGPK